MAANSNNASQQSGRLDWLKWLIVILLIFAGVVANYHYSAIAWAVRAAVGIVLLAILIAIALQTVKGERAWGFIKGARAELRKVVWPTRQETVQTTLIVVVMVVVAALFLWGIDSLFMWLVAWLTGQRG